MSLICKHLIVLSFFLGFVSFPSVSSAAAFFFTNNSGQTYEIRQTKHDNISGTPPNPTTLGAVEHFEYGFSKTGTFLTKAELIVRDRQKN